MASAFETMGMYGPATFVAKAIVASILADVLLLGFIFLRRAYRKRHFVKRDARLMEFRSNWDALLSGQIPYESWRTNAFDRPIVEEIALDAFEVAASDESARLLRFLRASGLIEKRIFEARKHRGWRRHRALVALGRTRAPEGIPALSEGLRDSKVETRNAALRGLGRMGSTEAAEEILTWIAEVGLVVPALPLQNALINCCRERPQILLPYLRHAADPVREVLGRALGEVASPLLAFDLLELVDDKQPEIRAAAARALANTQTGYALDALIELTRDVVWYVRLRAVVALGKLHRPEALPHFVKALTDSNRLVRMRAAEALIDQSADMIPIFRSVVATRDRYGLHGYLAALENAGLRATLEAKVKETKTVPKDEAERLLQVLHTASLPDMQENATSAEVAAMENHS
jgi:HEAT repeat protein